jgi:glucose-1-phosphate cytidylyltransferase
MQTGKMEVLNNSSEPWKITLLDTGINSMTGGRVKRAQNFVGNEPFMLTYGDGVSDINIEELVKFHKSHGKAITMTSAQPDGRFGALEITEYNQVKSFHEKPKGDGHWINAGFFVCEPKVFDYIENDLTTFEQEPLKNLAFDGEMFTYKHEGFWKPMDTLKDKNDLNKLWDTNKAPWKIW